MQKNRAFFTKLCYTKYLNLLHPERILTMRKEILLPAVAVAGGAVGFALRHWELTTAFEADTGLPIAGAPATYALIAFSVVMVALLAVLSLTAKYPKFQGYDQAFSAKNNTLYATVGVLSGFLLIGAGGLMVYEFMQGTNLLYTRIIVAAMAVASGLCVMTTVQSNFKGQGGGKYSVPLLIPAFAFCVWLIAAYQVRAGDPVQLDYVYELFAIITSLLALYFMAGFSFEKAKCGPMVFFSLLGIYFSMTTLADRHDWGTLALYAFSILYLLISSALLLYNAARPLPAAEPDENDNDTEGPSDV